MEKRKAAKSKNPDEIVITCHQCGHNHHFESFEVLDCVPISTRCVNCGFLFLKHVDDTLRKLTDLMMTDSKASELARKGKINELSDYFKKKQA